MLLAHLLSDLHTKYSRWSGGMVFDHSQIGTRKIATVPLSQSPLSFFTKHSNLVGYETRRLARHIQCLSSFAHGCSMQEQPHSFSLIACEAPYDAALIATIETLLNRPRSSDARPVPKPYTVRRAYIHQSVPILRLWRSLNCGPRLSDHKDV